MKLLTSSDLVISNQKLKDQIFDKVSQMIESYVQSNTILEGTYNEIFSLYKNSQLIPGQRYAITDYECTYMHPSGGNDEMFEMTIEAPDVEYIILTALTSNKFDFDVEYIRAEGYAKILECKYVIDPEELPFTRGTKAKGGIFYMKDEYENECSYDFKHVKYRRYAIKDITANMDINDGTGGFAGPYKCMMTDTAYKFSDTRSVIGSGDAWDKTFIPNAFAGKWKDAGVELYTSSSGPYNYSEDFIKKSHKPYQNEQLPWDKYLSWQTNMREQYGLSAPISKGSCQVYGQAVVDVDANDWVLRYTFDYNGEDASEMFTSGANTTEPTDYPLVSNCSIVSNKRGFNHSSNEALPNTVIIMSENAYKASNASRIEDVRLITSVSTPAYNTFLLRSQDPTYAAQMINVHFEDYAGYSCMSNLCMWRYCYGNEINGFQYNFFVGNMVYWNISDYMLRNVLFGHSSNIKGGTLNDSLLWGIDSYIQYEGETKLKSCADGNYWYDTVWRDWFAYNIIGPNQYSSFKPHFNTNSVRGVYNKGVDWGPTNQGSSFGRMAWGTNIGYGALQGGIKIGPMFRVDVAPGAFKTVAITNSTGQEMFNNDQPGTPTMWNCDIRSFQGDPRTIKSDLTETQLTRLATNGGSSRPILTVLNGKWTLLEQDGSVIP